MNGQEAQNAIQDPESGHYEESMESMSGKHARTACQASTEGRLRGPMFKLVEV